FEAVRKGEQALDFGYPQPAVVPMERPHIRSRLGLNGRARLVRIKLEQKGPVATTPLKQGLGVPTFCGVMKVVFAGWNAREQVEVLAFRNLFEFGLCDQTC